MRNLRSLRDIGMVDEYGEVYDKFPYMGKRGFKIAKINDPKNNIIYSLEIQKKLFVIPDNVPIMSNYDAIVFPIKHIRDKIDPKYQCLCDDEKMLGVFNIHGALIGMGKRINLQKDFFLASNEEFLGGEEVECYWGLYNYEGEEIFPKKYTNILYSHVEISGQKEVVFSVSVGGGLNALLSSDKREIIPYGSYNIHIHCGDEIQVVGELSEKNAVYLLEYDEDGKVIAREL